MRTSQLARGNSDVTEVVSAMTKNYATKLEQASISHHCYSCCNDLFNV